MTAARDIYQDWLDATSDVILAGDFEAMRALVSLPYMLRSIDGATLVETRKDMEEGFLSFGAMLRAQGATHYIRLAVAARYLSDTYIEGHHIAHVLRGAAAVLPAFNSRVVLRRAPETWKLVEQECNFRHGDWPINWIKVIEPESAECSADRDIRAENREPLSLYQEFLNDLTRANVRGDFTTYQRLLGLPFSFHTGGEDYRVVTPEDMRGFFDYITQSLEENRIEDFLRVADRAEFVGRDLLCGYHSCRLLKDGTDAVEPIKSRMVLQRSGTAWRAVSITNAMADGCYPTTTPRGLAHLVTHREIQKRTRQ